MQAVYCCGRYINAGEYLLQVTSHREDVFMQVISCCEDINVAEILLLGGISVVLLLEGIKKGDVQLWEGTSRCSAVGMSECNRCPAVRKH